MSFDPFANQGGEAAWDPDAAAATKKAADKLFADLDEVDGQGPEPQGAISQELPDDPMIGDEDASRDEGPA